MSGDLKTVFWEAIRSLATGDESIQARLGGAALRLGSLRPEDLPEDERQEFTEIMQQLRGGEGGLEERASAMSSKQCRQIATRILDLFVEVTGGL